jgi:isopenicillin N synthase-like dioxygenase
VHAFHGSSSPDTSASLLPSARLPILDLGRLDHGRAEHAAFLAELRGAAHDVGFFYLTGHGIEPAACEEVMSVAREFFALEETEKLAVEMVHSPHFRGYTRAGGELTRGAQDWREQFDIASERDAIWRPGMPAWMRLQGPNQWPQALPALRPVLLSWQARMTAVAAKLLRAFAEALGQEPHAFDPVFEIAPNQHLKIIRYPGRDAVASEQGVGPHKDSGILTLVLQDTEAGLEVEAAAGTWVEAPPRPGTFVVNIGELLELASEGYLRATMHRVVAPRPGATRLSVAFFLGARHDCTMPSLELPPELACMARGPARDPENPLFQHAGTNYLKGRLRSHPDVALRHYAGLADPTA